MTLCYTIAKTQFRRRLFRERGCQCAYCGRGLTRQTSTLDHVLPLSRGGSRHAGNVVVACRACNEVKADRTPIEWAADILEAAAAAGVLV